VYGSVGASVLTETVVVFTVGVEVKDALQVTNLPR